MGSVSGSGGRGPKIQSWLAQCCTLPPRLEEKLHVLSEIPQMRRISSGQRALHLYSEKYILTAVWSVKVFFINFFKEKDKNKNKNKLGAGNVW